MGSDDIMCIHVKLDTKQSINIEEQANEKTRGGGGERKKEREKGGGGGRGIIKNYSICIFIQ